MNVKKNHAVFKNLLKLNPPEYIFAYLMMLAFLIDQVQQRCCGLFQAALKKTVSRIALWERLRSMFFHHFIQEWSDVWNAIAYGFKRHALTPDTS